MSLGLGLGLGAAFAADAILPVPEAALTDTTSADATSRWRLFDPGFIVDHLPFKLTVGQTITYNDNVQNIGNLDVFVNNNTITRLPSRGDFYSDTTISGASRFPMGSQTVFFNGTYAPRRYFTDTSLDADNYAINGGVDFNVADRCTGRLIGGQSSNQQEQIETVGFGVITTTSTSFNETARCRITGHIAGLFNSGVSKLDNIGDARFAASTLSFGLNDYMQHYVGVGLEYALSGLDVLRANATFTERDFTNRPASLAALGLVNETEQNDFIFYYGRTFSAKLDANVSGGVSLYELGTSSADLVEPNYAFNVNYRFTPKLAAAFTESHSSGAPESAISNVEINDAQALSLSYAYSPKLSFSGILSRTETRNPQVNNAQLQGVVPLLYTNQNANNASLVANYSISPLVSATASYSYNERTDTSRSGFRAVSNIFRVGLFYTR